MNGDTGFTRYFEFGRYEPLGRVRSHSIPNIGLSSTGLNARDFHNAILETNFIASRGRASIGTIVPLPDGGFENALAFAESAVADSVAVMGEYDALRDIHCYGFAKQVVGAGGVDLDRQDGIFLGDNIPANAMRNIIDERGGFLVSEDGAEFLTGESSRILGRNEFENGTDFDGEPVERDWEVENIREKLPFCFTAGTLVDMWDGSQKPIEQVKARDAVVSFDAHGNKVKGVVTRTFANTVEHVLDFHGTGVTPGHVYLCGAGPHEGEWRKLFDILCDDGTIVDSDGHSRRAATMARVGSPEDALIRVLTVQRRPDTPQTGAGTVTGNGLIRAQTLFLTEEGNATDIKPTADPRLIGNLSVWQDAETLFDFVYRTAHTAVMAQRRQWFERFATNHQALWWVPAGHTPEVDEGLARLWQLDLLGPTPTAFTFKTRFPAPDRAGPPVDMNPDPWCHTV